RTEQRGDAQRRDRLGREEVETVADRRAQRRFLVRRVAVGGVDELGGTGVGADPPVPLEGVDQLTGVQRVAARLGHPRPRRRPPARAGPRGGPRAAGGGRAGGWGAAAGAGGARPPPGGRPRPAAVRRPAGGPVPAGTRSAAAAVLAPPPCRAAARPRGSA